MKSTNRLFAAVLLAGAAALSACNDGLLRPAAPAGPASVSIAASMQSYSGGIAEAYQRVNQLSVRFTAGTEVRLEEILAFDPAATQTTVSVQVPLEDVTETLSIELQLRANGAALFQGTGQVQLTAGGASTAPIVITPIVAAVTCAGTPVQLRAYGAVRRINGFALFASGDTIPGIPISWSVPAGAVVTVAQTGDVTALQQDGTAQVTCSTGSFAATREVQVLAIVTAVQITPRQATAEVGSTVGFTAALRDSLGNPITSSRPLTWASGNTAVATIAQNGSATAVTPGTAFIRATSGNAVDSVLLTVVFPPPLVTTTGSSNVTASGATLGGAVNPRGAPTTSAWFEWGTAPDLAGASSTPQQAMDPGNAFQPFSQTLGGLLANVTYYFRAAAISNGGTTRGAILSFNTAARPVVRTISSAPSGTGATLQGGVNPLGLSGQGWFEYSTDSLLTNPTRTAQQAIAATRTEQAITATISGLTPGARYFFRAAGSNAVGTTLGSIQSFTAISTPTVTTNAVAFPATGVTFNGTVNPNGSTTSAWFEYAAGSTFPGTFSSTTSVSIGAGTANVATQFQLASGTLLPNTTYVYRAAGSNAAGTARGNVVTFTMPPAPPVRTLASFFYNFGSGTVSYLNGDLTAVPPVDTQVWFEWSSSDSTLNVNRNSTAIQLFPAGYNPVEGGLAFYDQVPGVVYFRAVARNASGIRRGTIMRTQSYIAVIGTP